MNTINLKWINGLKGAMALWVTIFHYLLAFAYFGFIGWNSIPTTAEAKAAYFWQYFPYSVITNCSLPLFVFFAIIGFLPAYKFLATKDDRFLKEQALVRYFRFLPYVLLACLISYAVNALGLYYNQDYGVLAGNNWAKYMFRTVDLSFKGVLYDSFIGAFLHGTNNLSVLWCMNVIFFGSYLVYGTLLCFGEARKRNYIYALIAIALYFAPIYAAFLAGIIAADVIFAYEKQGVQKQNSKGIFYIALGFIIANFPEILLPSWFSVFLIYAIGSYFFLLGCYHSSWAQNLLNANWLQWLGDRSFSVIITHTLILFSFSCWQFIKLTEAGYSYEATLAITLLSGIIPCAAIAHVFDKIVTPISKGLGRKLKTLL